jgi:hypothetical protein
LGERFVANAIARGAAGETSKAIVRVAHVARSRSAQSDRADWFGGVIARRRNQSRAAVIASERSDRAAAALRAASDRAVRLARN